MSYTTHHHRVFGLGPLLTRCSCRIRPFILEIIGISFLLLFLSVGFSRFDEIRGASDLSVYRDIGMRAEAVYTGSRDQVDSEYPPTMTGILCLVNGSVQQGGDFARAWVLFICIATVFAWICLRCLGREDAAMAAVALFLTTRFLGPQLVFGRYDILMTLALFLSWRTHVHKLYAQSAAWLTLAVALKVVPLLAFPLLIAATPRHRWPSLVIGAVAAGFIALLLPVAILGAEGTRLNIIYILSYHNLRPVQLESFWSGLSFLFSLLVLRKDTTGFSHMSFANFAIGSFPFLAAKILIGIGILFLLIRGYRSRTERGFGLPMVALMTWSVGVSTVLSPQYMLWIVPLIFAVLGDRLLRGMATMRSAVLFLLTISVAGLTQWIFPLHYSAVIGQEPAAVVILNLRNGILLVIVYHLLVEGGYFRSLGSRMSLPSLRTFIPAFCIDSFAVAAGLFLLVTAYPHLFPVVNQSVWRSGEEAGAVSSLQLSRDFPSDRLQFTASLTIPAFAQHRWFSLRVDDCLEGIKVNGVALPASVAFCDAPGPGRTVDLGGFLRTGRNTVSIDVKNNGGPMGLHLTPRPTPLILLILFVTAMVCLWYGMQCYRMAQALSPSLQAEGLKMFYTLRNIWSKCRSSAQDSWMISAGLKPTRFI